MKNRWEMLRKTSRDMLNRRVNTTNRHEKCDEHTKKRNGLTDIVVVVCI